MKLKVVKKSDLPVYFISFIIDFIIILFQIVLLWKVFKIKKDEHFVVVDTNRSCIKDDESYGKSWIVWIQSPD